MINDEVVVGVVSAPALGRRWWASLGGGAYAGKSLMSPIECHVSASRRSRTPRSATPRSASWVDAGQGQEFVDLLRTCWRTRAYGDFWSYMLVAEGAVDIACEPDLELHDMAACSIVVTEAGGRFTDLDGRPGPWARARTRRTGCCTTPCWSSCGRSPTTPTSPRVDGVLLAAGAGRRAGGPKGLRRDGSGEAWVRRSAEVLLDGGCDRVLVVVGAAGDEVAALLADRDRARSRVEVVRSEDWACGMSASLTAGLRAVTADAALVHLVDLPDVGADVVRRVLERGGRARDAWRGPRTPAARATRSSWAPTTSLPCWRPSPATRADAPISMNTACLAVECGDLATGRDDDASRDHIP